MKGNRQGSLSRGIKRLFDLFRRFKKSGSQSKRLFDWLLGRHGIVPPVLLLLCLPNGPEGGNERRFLRRGDQIGGGSHFLIAAAVGV